MKPGRRRMRFALGAALVAASWAEARRREVPGYEERVFRAVNEAPDELRPAVRLFMQAGTFGLTPVFSVLAWRAGRPRLAATLAASGTAAWLGAKVVKRLGGRGRPFQELPGVRVRESIGGERGWVSGHAAVSTALALTAAEELPTARPMLLAWAGEVSLARMYVGAHLPHDIAGGVGLGMMIASVVDGLARTLESGYARGTT